jgi:hypothetical protein
MDRRRFIQLGAVGGALALGAIGTGGVLVARRTQARKTVASDMLNDALPPLKASASKSLTTLPARAREEIKRYFHGKCLNVEGFVSHICSDGFVERLGRCSTPDEKEACFLQAFCSRVAGEDEIINQVETIAADLGGELDDEWTMYCAKTSLKWNTRIQGYGAPLAADELTNRLSGLIRHDLGLAARLAMSADQRPSVGQTIGKIGESAIRLLPLAQLRVEVGWEGVAIKGNLLVIPVFLIEATRAIWDYIMGRLDDRRAENQAAISGRLAMLGNRVGGELEREVRLRITDLNTWQEGSIRDTAVRLSEERVNLI